MFLKSLTLRGFKTFADTVEVEFGSDSRITAIVGPNGCGKSNILDATRWVLGEDNPRHLRVASLPEIIFAGTNKRKPLSMAEVTLLFDNSAGKLPLAFSEVAIRRRTFREGESEFFINKNLCRLKDIRDLLLDTGLGEATYSIITQGQVDAVLSSKGEERRAVFEEAAGINKYKTRKQNAERKLIAAEQNILRINDLKVEVSEHLITLEEQARRAQEYLHVQAEIKELELGLSKKVFGNMLEKKTKLAEDLAKARLAAEAKEAEEQKDETKLQSLREALRQKEIEIDEALSKLETVKDQLRDLELNRRFIEGELERAGKLTAELAEKKAGLEKKITGLQAESAQPAVAAGGYDYPALAAELSAVIDQLKQTVELSASLLSFFGVPKIFSFGGREEIVATVNLKLEILQAEIKRLDDEAAKVDFGRHAHRSQLEALPKTEAEQVSGEALAGLKTERDSLRQKISTLEDKIRGENRSEREAGGNITVIEIAMAKLEGEMTGLSERLFSEYNLSLSEIEALPYSVASVPKARTDLEEKKARLRSLEPVNLLAIEEFEKNRERLTFIDAQLNDLNNARENLKNLIVELDARAEESFLQTMQQLSIVFSETFAKLFNGGEAKITLTPGLPPLEAEVEISVRPAERRWLPLALLSGGERSLCAIAILFSLLKIRPSPFCFLDEVDAALDEANIGRFTEMLKDFASAETQMLVITHNKRTMAAADNIYGITMEEPGISKVISMRLAEATL